MFPDCGLPVAEAFDAIAEKYAGKVAIIGDSSTINFDELASESVSLSDTLGKMVRGRVIGLCIEQPLNFMVAYLAIARSGARLVLVDPRSSMSERQQICNEMTIEALLVTIKELPTPSEPKSKFRTAAGMQFFLIELDHGSHNCDARYEAGDFVVHTTSGSTGSPKGIALSAQNVLARIDSWRSSVYMSDLDTILCMLSLSHCHGIEILMLPALLSGCTVVAPHPNAITPRRILSLISEHRVTLISTLPWFYGLMIDSVEPEACDLTNLRMMISASAPLAPNLARRFKEKFGKQLRQAYGLSEIGAICLDRDGADDSTVGVPLDLVEVKLVSNSGVKDGTELIARGPGLARGYVNAPDAQGEMFRDGWLWSKDLVCQESSGYRIVGRTSRFINSGGNKIAPGEVEGALLECDAVRDVVVTGCPDPIEGERIVAYVVWKEGQELDRLQVHCRTKLAAYRCPQIWVSVSELPRNSIGKVIFHQLPPVKSQDQGNNNPTTRGAL